MESRRSPAAEPVRPRRAAGLAAAAIGAIAVLATLARVLGPRLLSRLPSCPLHELTGLYCPGCGTTRALYHLLRGEWLAACSANLLAVGAIGLGAIDWLARPWLAPRLASLGPRPRGLALLAGVLVVVAFAVLRNLAGTPFAWLAP